MISWSEYRCHNVNDGHKECKSDDNVIDDINFSLIRKESDIPSALKNQKYTE